MRFGLAVAMIGGLALLLTGCSTDDGDQPVGVIDVDPSEFILAPGQLDDSNGATYDREDSAASDEVEEDEPSTLDDERDRVDLDNGDEAWDDWLDLSVAEGVTASIAVEDWCICWLLSDRIQLRLKPELTVESAPTPLPAEHDRLYMLVEGDVPGDWSGLTRDGTELAAVELGEERYLLPANQPRTGATEDGGWVTHWPDELELSTGDRFHVGRQGDGVLTFELPDSELRLLGMVWYDPDGIGILADVSIVEFPAEFTSPHDF